jgi:ABC-2 type transport system ATP-binding protein
LSYTGLPLRRERDCLQRAERAFRSAERAARGRTRAARRLPRTADSRPTVDSLTPRISGASCSGRASVRQSFSAAAARRGTLQFILGLISTANLSHSYGSRIALQDLAFSVSQGAIYGVLGPNGGGKSTLFRILATMMRPTSGTASIAGFDLVRQPHEVRRRLGVVFQTQSLDRKLTVEENLRAQGHLYGLSGSELTRRIEDALPRLRLTDRRRDIVGTLSGGLKRRVEIAKALLHQPAVLLMDEPSTGLDPGARRELAQCILDLRASKGATILMTTHILDEAEHCDRLLLLHRGRKVAEGTPAELKSRVGGDVVVLEAATANGLPDRIAARFQVKLQVVDGRIRVEIANGHRFITEVVEAFPGAIQSIALHKPTLEDVFLDETGASLDGGE